MRQRPGTDETGKRIRRIEEVDYSVPGWSQEPCVCESCLSAHPERLQALRESQEFLRRRLRGAR